MVWSRGTDMLKVKHLPTIRHKRHVAQTLVQFPVERFTGKATGRDRPAGNQA